MKIILKTSFSKEKYSLCSACKGNHLPTIGRLAYRGGLITNVVQPALGNCAMGIKQARVRAGEKGSASGLFSSLQMPKYPLRNPTKKETFWARNLFILQRKSPEEVWNAFDNDVDFSTYRNSQKK